MGKEAIIFLHGMVGNRNAFKREIEKLEDRYQCIAYDFYDSDDFAVVSIDALVQQLYAHFVKAGITKAHLCSLSFGCLIAMAFSKKYPDFVISMTFVGGYTCHRSSQFYQNVTHLLKVKHHSEYKRWMNLCARLLNPNKQGIQEDSEAIFTRYALQVDPYAFEQVLRVHLDFDSDAMLSGLDKPILWVMGEWDDLYKETLTHLKLALPYVYYQEIKQAGHVAHVHQHQPFMVMFQSFLAKHVEAKEVSSSAI